MSETKNIVFFKRDLSAKGGLEKHTWLLVNAFYNKGYIPLMLTEKVGDSLPTDLPLTIKQLPKAKLRTRTQKLKSFDHFCMRYLEQNTPDIAFGLDRTSSQTHIRAGNGVHAAFLERIAPQTPLKRLIHTRVKKNLPFHREILTIEKRAFEDKRLKTLFTNSHMVKKEILHHYNTAPEKICVIHNGVEWESMSEDFEKWENRKQIFLANNDIYKDAFHLLFIGHGFQRKGLKELLQALSRIKNKDFMLSVVGKDKNLTYYQSLARKLGIAPKVHFWGSRDDVRSFYQAADALIIPSFYDPFANVTVEALAMGVPVVSSSSNGGSEILSPNTGIIVENLFDVEEFSHKLSQTLEQPKNSSQAKLIRQSVKHLDFSIQLEKLLKKTIEHE